jgi:hypothetical protein
MKRAKRLSAVREYVPLDAGLRRVHHLQHAAVEQEEARVAVAEPFLRGEQLRRPFEQLRLAARVEELPGELRRPPDLLVQLVETQR